MPVAKRKVYVYIVHQRRLLVFRHVDFPEAGLQVPGGTIEPSETPEAAALREATEETGLNGLKVISFLGEQLRDMSDFGLDQMHQRYFFQLSCPENLPEIWVHYETNPSDGSPGPIAFEFFWADLPDSLPTLIAEMDYYVKSIIAH